MIRIVLAEDHQVVRQGLRALLESDADLSIAGEADDGPAAARLVERLQPDVLVLDLMLPGLSGLEVTRRVMRRSPHTRVVVLSMHANEAYVREALEAGALAYVLKQSSSAELVRAIREAAGGRRYLSPPLSEHAVEAYRRRASSSADPYHALTQREREVLHLAAEGLTSAEIGARLYISPRTAEMHRGNLMRKLGLRSQTELVRYALQRGILSHER